MQTTMASKKLTNSRPPANTTRGTLLVMVEQHLDAAGINTDEGAAGFGWAAIKDSRLVDRLRNGGDITTAKLDDVVKYLNQFKRSKIL